MPAIHVRNLDDALVHALKVRAARHHRSLQGEVVEILERAAREDERSSRKGRIKLQIKTVRVGARTSYSREQIYGVDGR